jgi:hypothetical protein
MRSADTRAFIIVFVEVVAVASIILLSVGNVSADPASSPQRLYIDELLSPRTLVQVLAGSAVVTALINAVWFVVSTALLRLQHWWNAKNTVCSIALSRSVSKEKYDNIKDVINGFHCLLVRYGTDQYVSSMASDQEKYEGRLKNKVLPIDVNFDKNGNPSLTLNLPVHKRIGTQFKCFVSAKDDSGIPAVETFLKDCDRINGISVSHGVKSNRIYFLLERFGVAKTIDGFENNMILPE